MRTKQETFYYVMKFQKSPLSSLVAEESYLVRKAWEWYRRYPEGYGDQNPEKNEGGLGG